MSAVTQLSEVAKLFIAKRSFISGKILNGKLIMERYEGDAFEVGPIFDSSSTTAAIDAAIANLRNSAPSLLDTLGEIDAQLASDESAAAALLTLVTALRNVTDSTFKTALTSTFGPLIGSDNWLKAWGANPDNLIRSTTITRDSNGAATAASVIWPDGTAGAYTATTVSSAFPGAVDAYTVTYVGATTKTVTQPAVTRDATTGAVTTRPALTVT